MKTLYYELILLFEKWRFRPFTVYQKLKGKYNKSTIYRYYHRWLDADTKMRTMLKELV